MKCHTHKYYVLYVLHVRCVLCVVLLLCFSKGFCVFVFFLLCVALFCCWCCCVLSCLCLRGCVSSFCFCSNGVTAKKVNAGLQHQPGDCGCRMDSQSIQRVLIACHVDVCQRNRWQAGSRTWRFRQHFTRKHFLVRNFVHTRHA